MIARLDDMQRSAVEAAIGDVLGVARRYLSRCVRGRDPDYRREVEAVALLALAEAGLDLDPARADTFGSFARRRARWAVVDYLRRRNRDPGLSFCEFTMSSGVIDHARYRSAPRRGGRGRRGQVRGEDAPGALLDAARVVRAFEMAAEGETNVAIGRTLGVARNTVTMVLARQRWGHVPIPAELLEAVRARGDGRRRPGARDHGPDTVGAEI